MLIKLSANQKNYICQLTTEHLLQELTFKAQNLIASLEKPFQFFYIDQEGDEITVSADQDLKNIIQYKKHLATSDHTIIKIYIKKISEEIEKVQYQELDSDSFQLMQKSSFQVSNLDKLSDMQMPQILEPLVQNILEMQQLSEQKSKISMQFEQIQEDLIEEIINKELDLICQNKLGQIQHELQIQMPEIIAELKTKDEIKSENCSSKQMQDQDSLNKLIGSKLQQMIPIFMNEVLKQVKINLNRLISQGHQSSRICSFKNTHLINRVNQIKF